MKKTTLARKGHMLSTLNRQKAIERGLLGAILWNWKVGVVGQGFRLYLLFVRLLAGMDGFYLIWDLIAGRAEMETTYEEDKK